MFMKIYFVVVQSLSCVQLFATPWTVAPQVPLPMGFSRQEYWSGLPFASPGDPPNPGIEPTSPALLDESQAGIKDPGRNINNLKYAVGTTLMRESEQELKSLLMKVEEESEKAGLKLNIQKAMIIASGPITSWEIDGKKTEIVTNVISWAPKSLWIATVAMKIKDTCSFE